MICISCGREVEYGSIAVLPIGGKNGGVMCKECIEAFNLPDTPTPIEEPEMKLLTTECYYKECPYHNKDEPTGTCYVKDKKFAELCRKFIDLYNFKENMDKDVNSMKVANSAREIYEAMDKLANILYRNEKHIGDWYECVSHAVEYLKEALRSNPPGFQDYSQDEDE